MGIAEQVLEICYELLRSFRGCVICLWPLDGLLYLVKRFFQTFAFTVWPCQRTFTLEKNGLLTSSPPSAYLHGGSERHIADESGCIYRIALHSGCGYSESCFSCS
jgi:hypothetical protein